MALLGLPLTLAALLCGVPWAQRRGLPRDVSLAAGLGLGVGLLALVGFVLQVSRVPGRAGALAGLAAIALSLLRGIPRLPRRRELLGPLLVFGVATTGLVLSQRCPQGAAWANDWFLHYEIDEHYAAPDGMKDLELELRWSVLSRTPLFNLARVPAELIVERSYASAEAATLALALVLPAGAWLLLREIAPWKQARAGATLFAASAYWIHHGAYPKPMALATGLFLASLGIVLRAKRRDEPSLLPLAAALGALTGVAHPAAGLGLVPAAIWAVPRAPRAAAVALAIALPWPLWATAITNGAVLQHDPIRRNGGALPLGRGLDSVANLSWNATMGVLPAPLLGHGAALATGQVTPDARSILDVVLQAELCPLLGAVGVATAIALARAKARPPLGRFSAVAAAALGIVSLVGFARFVRPDVMTRGLIEHAGVAVDRRLPIFAVAAFALALLALALSLRGARGDHLAAKTAIFQAFVGLILHEAINFQGGAHSMATPATAVLALWAFSQAPSRAALVESALVLAGLLLFTWRWPDAAQEAWKAKHAFRSLSDGLPAWLGPTLMLVGLGPRIFGMEPRSSRHLF